MVELTLKPTTPLDGADTTIGSLRLREITNVALLSLAVPRGGEQGVANALKNLGLEMPDGKMSSVGNSIRATKTSPDQVFLFFEEGDAQITEKTYSTLCDAGYVTVQTDSWVACELSGPDSRTALERICPIDLLDDAFPVGAFARTSMEHLGVIILKTGVDRFVFLSASSSARSFYAALELSARRSVS